VYNIIIINNYARDYFGWTSNISLHLLYNSNSFVTFVTFPKI